MEGKCIVFFEDPFWVAVFERCDETGYATARFVFGAEPGDAELYRFAIEQFVQLSFSPAAPIEKIVREQIRFKRRQREARREVQREGPGTFAQRAVQAERERRKAEHRGVSRQEQEALIEERFRVKQEKKKQKKRGR